MRRIAIAVLIIVVLAVVLGASGLLSRSWNPPPNQDSPAPVGSPAIEEARSWIGMLLAAIDLRGSGRSVAFSGYVEADYVMVASTVGGTLTQLHVARGDRVAAGTLLFALDDIAERAVRDETAGKLRQAEAQLADLRTGRRPPEIDAIVAQRAQAEAALRHSEAEYQREVRLRGTGASSTRLLDEWLAQRDRDQSRLEELDAQIRIARMPGRDDEIRAAEAAVAAARASLAQAEWRLAQQTGAAPASGIIVDTLYRTGDMVPAGLPVVQMLPPENIKIRFFVPQRLVARIGVGQVVRVACDGCGPPIAATVRFISPRAEFTPPVIYSREQRARLVFMVEARPDERAEALRVGQPVDVTMVRW